MDPGNHHTVMTYTFPGFDGFPRVQNTPQGCVWGFYDKDGVKDEVGCEPRSVNPRPEMSPSADNLPLEAINLLTPEVVLNARSEIQTGRHLQLGWPLHSLKFPGFARKALQHQILDNHATVKDYAFDDEVHFNTQAGSQWDSLKHVRIS